MIRFVYKSIVQQKRFIFLFCLGLLLMLTTLPLLFISFKSVQVLIDDNISKHARGSYDLLVRPPQASLEIEEKLGVVEENYLDGGAGGISIDEWEDIRKLENVEIAAPIASLGFFTGESRSLSMWLPERSSRYTLQYYTSDGIQKYKIESTEDTIGIMIEQESKPGYSPPFDVVTSTWGYAEFQYATDHPPTFLLPPTYHLLAAIDPDSEEELTGISFKQLTEEYVKEPDEFLYGFAQEEDIPVIPLLKLLDPEVPLTAELTLEEINVDKEQTMKWKEEVGVDELDSIFWTDNDASVQIRDTLFEMPATKKEEYVFDFSDLIEPFEYEPIAFREDLTTKESIFFSGNIGNTSEFYQIEPLPYVFDENEELHINKLGYKNGIPVYRNIEEAGVSSVEFPDVPFMLYTTGEYTVAEKAETLSASPLGIYQLAPNKLIEDEDGQLLQEEKEVFSTIYPGSFVAAPAHGVIDINDAPIMKGEHPIDAVRVRVGGIDQYDELAESKIEAVAKEILDMGFAVDVVAGASYQEIPVKVDGLGTVMKPWTTLGSAASIIDSWNAATIWMTVLFSICSLIYIANRIQFHRESKVEEMGLLHQVGWSHKHINQLFRLEFIIIFLFTWSLSLVSLYLMRLFLAETTFIDLFKWNIGLASFTIAFMLLVIEVNPTFKRRRKHSKKEKKPNLSSHYLSIQSIKYYMRFLYSAGLQLILVSLLSIFVFLSLNVTVQHTNVTMLGQYINFNISSIHIVILVSAYILAAVTIIESISTLMITRKEELNLLKSIGWTNRDIMKTLIKEVFLWSSAAVLLGHALGFILYALNSDISLFTLGFTALSIGAFILLILLISTVVIWKGLKDMLRS